MDFGDISQGAGVCYRLHVHSLVCVVLADTADRYVWATLNCLALLGDSGSFTDYSCASRHHNSRFGSHQVCEEETTVSKILDASTARAK